MLCCAQVKLLEPAEEPGSIAGFLGKAVEPPVSQAVDHAITLLQVCIHVQFICTASIGGRISSSFSIMYSHR